MVRGSTSNGGGADHTDALGTVGIGRLLTRLAIPSSVALFVSSTYNLVDTIFVGRGVGVDAIGALTLVFPFQMLVMAFGNLIGIGASSVVSRSLGARNAGHARRAAGNGIGMAAAVGLAILLTGQVLSGQLAAVLGATGGLTAPTVIYLKIILIGVPFQIANIAMNSVIRAEGHARTAMMTMVSGMLLNIALDPVFIFVLGWGIRGAGLGTVFSQALTTALIASFYARGRGAVRISWESLIPSTTVIGEIVKIGSSGFARQLSMSIVQSLRNNLLVAFGGTVFISAFGVVFRSLLFLAMPAMGVAQALPPVAGYNFGAGNIERVRHAVWLSVLASTALNTVGFAIMMLFPATLLGVFSSDPALIGYGVSIMRVNAVGMLFFAAYFTGPSFYQAVGKPIEALALALSRPLIATLIMFAGVKVAGAMGVVAADPAAILTGAVLAVVFMRRSFSGWLADGVRS